MDTSARSNSSLRAAAWGGGASVLSRFVLASIANHPFVALHSLQPRHHPTVTKPFRYAARRRRRSTRKSPGAKRLGYRATSEESAHNLLIRCIFAAPIVTTCRALVGSGRGDLSRQLLKAFLSCQVWALATRETIADDDLWRAGWTAFGGLPYDPPSLQLAQLGTGQRVGGVHEGEAGEELDG